jgi:hypothetical protein
VAISAHTRKILWSLSGNACARCAARLVEGAAAAGDPHAIVGRECHIVARAPLGPRGTSGSRDDLDGYDNLILLCANCHAIVDGQPQEFPPDELQRLKKTHEQSVRVMGDPSMLDISLRGRDAPIQLEPILSGDVLLSLVGPAASWVHDYPDGLSETQRELVGDFLESCRDWSEAYDDIGPKGQLDGGQRLQEHINSLLVDEELAVFAGTRQLVFVGNGKEVPWREAMIRIVDVRGAGVRPSVAPETEPSPS